MQQRVSAQGQIMAPLIQYLDLPGNTYSTELYVEIAEIWKLPDAVDRATSELVNPAVPVETFSDDLQRARGAVTLLSDLRTPGATFLQQIEGSTVKSVQVISHLLNSAAGMTAVTQESIDAVGAAAQELIALIKDDDSLDKKLKRVLFEHAFAIIGAVHRFKISGAEGILREYDTLTGHFANHPATMVAVSNHPALRQAVVKLGSALLLVSGLLGNVVAIEGQVKTIFGIESAATVQPVPSPTPDSKAKP